MLKALACSLILLLPQYTIPQHGGALAASSGGGTAPSVVQSQANSAFAGTLATASPVTAGNVLVVTLYSGPASSSLTVTDSLGNTFTTLASANLNTDGDVIAIACAPITTGGSDTLTFLRGGSNLAMGATAYEVHTTHGTCTQDVTAVFSNTTGATACNSGPMTTSTANDFLIAACGMDGSQTTTTAAGSGWSGVLNVGNSGQPSLLVSESRVGTSPGSFTATTGAIVSEEQTTLLVALKP